MNERSTIASSTDIDHRVVVFTGDLSYSVRKGIVCVDRALTGSSWLVLVHAPRRRTAQLVKSQWSNLRRNGWRWIPYAFADLRRRAFVGAAAALPNSAPGAEFTAAAFAARANVEIVRVHDIHSPEAIERVRRFAPALGIALAAPILRRELFGVPRAGTLNLHKGKVPEYRGMPPAFWELCNDERSVGCTVHWVDDKLDTGAIVARTELPREPFSTLKGLQLQLDEGGVELVRVAVTDAFEGAAAALPQGPGGRTYRKPTLAQLAALECRLAERHPPHETGPKAWLKSGLGAGLHAAWRGGLHRALAPRITVLLYHRVTDTARDNLSVGVEQFDRQMALLRRHCRVLSIDEVLAAEVIPRSRQPLVCVTFDDGYLDNHANAVPILLRHGIPAAFFVATGIIGTDQAFAHDVRRHNGPIPKMDWAQLRSMHAQGFTIGSHTVNHIDCAAEPEATVWSELVRSRDDLKRELGIGQVILGYPYGGRQHMTPARLDLVRQVGYAGCLSAYGGSNLRRVERFNVLRRGIQWACSDQSFMRQCMGVL